MFDPAAEAVLRRRAEQLATLPIVPDEGDEVEVLACRLGKERYAVETRHLRAVQWVSGITPVPCTPGYVIGIVSVRGEIVTVLDLAALIGLEAHDALDKDGSYPALLLGLPGIRAGLVVEEVLGVEHMKLHALQASLGGREFTRGIGSDDTVLLNLEALLFSGRLNVAAD
jgi:purine-binding chemotaxis protein CheW